MSSNHYRLKADFANNLGAVPGSKKTDHGASLSSDWEKARFEFMRDDIVRLKISQGEVFEETSSVSVPNPTSKLKKFDYEETRRETTLKSRSLTVRFSKPSFNISETRADGAEVLQAFSGEGFPQLSRSAFKLVFHGSAEGMKISWNGKHCEDNALL